MIKTAEINNRTFFLREVNGPDRFVMAGENIDGKMEWRHMANEAAALSWISKITGVDADKIELKDRKA